jgi:hypothetical protein
MCVHGSSGNGWKRWNFNPHGFSVRPPLTAPMHSTFQQLVLTEGSGAVPWRRWCGERGGGVKLN